MKGIVFTEFLDFVARHHGEDMVDDLIEACPLASGGAYTAVGTYDHAEMAALCGELSRRTGHSAHALVKGFGEHLSRTFEGGYPDFFVRSAHYFDFLESIEAHIHHEVHKLYPDAELPTFQVVSRDDRCLVIDYRSPRRMGALAEGLMEGTARHFGVTVRVGTEPLESGDGTAVRFTVEIV